MSADDLARFIAERLDEHEQGTQAASAAPWRPVEFYSDTWLVEARDGYELAKESGHGDINRADAEHIARHDPAHVLAFVAAGRAIVAEHAPDELYPEWCRRCDGMTRHDDRTGVSWPCPTLRAFGAIWAGHPAWREEWRT